MTGFLTLKKRNKLEILSEMICKAPQKTFGIFFSQLAKFDKRYGP